MPQHVRVTTSGPVRQVHLGGMLTASSRQPRPEPPSPPGRCTTPRSRSAWTVAGRCFSCVTPSCCQRLLVLLIEDPPIPDAEISAMLGIPAGSIGPTRRRCLYRPGFRPVIAVVSCRDRGVPRSGGVQPPGSAHGGSNRWQGHGNRFRGPGCGAGTARQQREAVTASPVSKRRNAAAEILPAPRAAIPAHCPPFPQPRRAGR